MSIENFIKPGQDTSNIKELSDQANETGNNWEGTLPTNSTAKDGWDGSLEKEQKPKTEWDGNLNGSELNPNKTENMQTGFPDYATSKGELPTQDFKQQVNFLEKNQTEFLPRPNADILDVAYSTHLPQNGGEWGAERGDSTWKPDRETTPAYPGDKTWGEILDENDIEGIDFKDNEPDFSEISEGTVEIDDFTTERVENFTQADERLAEKFSKEKVMDREWTPDEVKEYRQNNNLTWHERSDMKTMDLVPREVHANIPHSGGISEAKNGASHA